MYINSQIKKKNYGLSIECPLLPSTLDVQITTFFVFHFLLGCTGVLQMVVVVRGAHDKQHSDPIALPFSVKISKKDRMKNYIFLDRVFTSR